MKQRSLAPTIVWGGRIITVAVLIAIPHIVGTRLAVYTNGVIFILIFVSLRLLVRTSGQVSLCHAAFAAVGAASFSQLAAGHGIPWLLAVLGAGLITVPVGAVVAVPAIRLSGLYLALATFGFGILMERMVYGTNFMFGTFTGHRHSPRPHLAGLASDTGYYYVCLTLVLVGCAVVYSLNRSRLGRMLRAMADSPLAMSTHGASVNVTRVLVFCLSAFLAGVAGALFGALSGSISGVPFGSFQSLMWLTVLAVAGAREFSAPVLAAVLLVVAPAYVGKQSLTDWQPVVFGAIAVLSVLAQGRQSPLAIQSARFRRYVNGIRRRWPSESWAQVDGGDVTSPTGAAVEEVTSSRGVA